MSHQALPLGQIRSAVDLARSAWAGTADVAPPRALAMFAAMEAMAQAAGGNRHESTGALARAEKALARLDTGYAQPDWLDFDEGGLWGHAARAYRYLDNAAECERHAERATALCLDAHGRTRAQRQALLAAGQLCSGNVDQAADTGTRIITTAWSLSSRHVDQEIAAFSDAVARTGSTSPTCRTFVDHARTYLAARAARVSR